MTRAKIGVVVAVIVAVLTGAAYVLASRRLEAAARHAVEAPIGRAQRLLHQISLLQSFDIMARARGFARDENVRRAIEEPAARDQAGASAIQGFLGSLEPAAGKPDFVAIVNATGAVVAADSPLPDSDDLRSRFKAVAAALDKGQVSKDIWDYGKNTVRVGVAPVPGAGGAPIGAVIVAYAIDSREAIEHAGLLGTDLIFFAGERVVATSFGTNLVDTLGKHAGLKKLARDALAGSGIAPVEIELGGETYLATAAALPLNFDNRETGAIALASLDDARGQASIVEIIILVLGAAAILVALFAMWVTARMLFHQTDEIEAGITEIINGNVDHVFRPVGADVDGLANGLNVMLARLLGRPDPTPDDSFGGAAATSGGVLLDEAGGSGTRVSQDPDVLALAREPEADYLRRVYEEFIAARRAAGENVQGVTFDSFAAKLRLSEANLRKKYSCRAVRFKVQTRDQQVTLKPVPIL